MKQIIISITSFLVLIFLSACGFDAANNPNTSSDKPFVCTGTGLATLTWNPPVDSMGNPVAVDGYRIYFGPTSGGPYPIMIDVGNVVTYEINNLCTMDLYFVATAYRGFDESVYSNEASKVFTEFKVASEIKLHVKQRQL